MELADRLMWIFNGALLVVIALLMLAGKAYGYKCVLNQGCPLGDFILNETTNYHTPINFSACNASLYYGNGSTYGNWTATNSSIGWHGYNVALTEAGSYDFVLCCGFLAGERECYSYPIETSDYCRPSHDCAIRVFLFNDTTDYNTPINISGCNISLYDNANTALLADQAMDNNSNGKHNYSYTFTAASDYKALICCDFNDEYQCMTERIHVEVPGSCPPGGVSPPIPPKVTNPPWNLFGSLWYFPSLSEYWKDDLSVSTARGSVVECAATDVRCTTFINKTTLSHQPTGLFLFDQVTGKADIYYANGEVETIHVTVTVINAFALVLITAVAVGAVSVWYYKRRKK